MVQGRKGHTISPPSVQATTTTAVLLLHLKLSDALLQIVDSALHFRSVRRKLGRDVLATEKKKKEEELIPP